MVDLVIGRQLSRFLLPILVGPPETPESALEPADLEMGFDKTRGEGKEIEKGNQLVSLC